MKKQGVELKKIFETAVRCAGSAACLSTSAVVTGFGAMAFTEGTLSTVAAGYAEIESILAYASFVGAFGIGKLGFFILDYKREAQKKEEMTPFPGS